VVSRSERGSAVLGRLSVVLWLESKGMPRFSFEDGDDVPAEITDDIEPVTE